MLSFIQRSFVPDHVSCQHFDCLYHDSGCECGLWLLLQAFMDGLQEVQAYLKTGITPPGFSVMPISPEQAPDGAAAKMGKRPGSSKAKDDLSGGPGISKDAGMFQNDVPAASAFILLDNSNQNRKVVPPYGNVCSLCSGQDAWQPKSDSILQISFSTAGFAGKMAAARKKEAEKAAAARAAALQRKQRALKKLGLVAPRSSPFKEEPCLDAARTWFAQVATCSQRWSCHSNQAYEETHAGVADADCCVDFHIVFGLH